MICNYTALDVETTGLNAKHDKIIEVSAIKVRDGRITDTYQSLIYPGRKLSEEIILLTGISDRELELAPESDEIIPELISFIGDDILLGHRVLFDYSFIKKYAVNLGMSFEKMGIDTLKLARQYLSNLESRRLSYLCSYYGISHHAHRAYDDAAATCELYQKLVKEFYHEKTFEPFPLFYQVKKEFPASNSQKERLYKLAIKHKLILEYDVDKLTRNEASRKADQIILKYGR